MATSNKNSNTFTPLPNRCYVSPFKILPANRPIEKDWIICYTFHDPDLGSLRRQIRGMNHFKNKAQRELYCARLIESELELLRDGFNPFKKEILPSSNTDVSPYTPFITALRVAYTKIHCVSGTMKDINSILKGTEAAAKSLSIDKKPIKDVTRKYFKLIFEQCRKDNLRFTNNRQNVYRKWLKKLFDELIEMEAVESNPLVFIKKEKTVKKDRRLPTDEERKEINNYLKTTQYNLWRAIQIFFASGSRETELMSVQKKHVDLKEQRCLYTVNKGRVIREVWRPITDSSLPFWEEILSEANDDDYLFSLDLKPGKKHLKTEALSRRWQRYVKGTSPAKKGYNKKDTGCLHIDVDLYTLKHLNTTEIMNALDKEYNPAKDVQKLTGHTSEAMIIKIYDKNNKERKDDKIKRIGNNF